MPSSSACTCALGEGLGRCGYAPIPQRLARRPTAPHCTAREKGEGVTHLRSFLPSGSLMFWPTRPAAWRHRNSVAKTAACGASKNCKHPPTNTRPESHLFHDKTTCNLTGASWPMDSRVPLPTAPALGGAGCASGVQPNLGHKPVTVQPLLCRRVCRVRAQLTFHLAHVCCQLCKIPDGHCFFVLVCSAETNLHKLRFFSTRVWPWITKLLAIAKRMLVATMPPPNPQP